MAITIKQLFEDLKQQMEQGHGDYVVFVTDDEEANGYHALWYLGQNPVEMDDESREYTEQINCDLKVCENKDKAYYVG